MNQAFPLEIVVYCDGCGAEVSGDYVVHDGMTRMERLRVARTHLAACGWSCTEETDLCPSCAAVVS